MIKFKEYLVENKGHDYERSIVRKLKQKGHLEKNYKIAGSGRQVDAHFNFQGRHALEIKHTPLHDMGQLYLHHCKEHGWHVSNSSKSNYPEAARHVESSGILSKMNKHPEWDKFAKGELEKPEEIVHHHSGVEPIKDYYGKDKKVDYMQIGGKGLYHLHDNPAKVNSKQLHGNTMMRVRAKENNKRADGSYSKSVVLSFKLHKPLGNLQKSKVSIDAD